MTGLLSRGRTGLENLLLTETDGLGVFLGKSELTLAHVRQGRGRFQVQGLTRLAVPGGNLEDLGSSLREQVAAWGLEGCPVNLAVSSHLGFLRPATLPKAAAENLARVVAYELDRYVPLPPERLYYGFQVTETTDTEIHLMLLALARERVDACLEMLRQAGLRPLGLTLGPLAAANAFAAWGAKRLPDSWLLLHLEADGYGLTHLQGGLIQNFSQVRELQNQPRTEQLLAGIGNLAAKDPAPKVLCVYGASPSTLRMGSLPQYPLEVIFPGQVGLDTPPGAEGDDWLPAVGAALACLTKPLVRLNLLPPEERAQVRGGNLSTTVTLLVAFLSLLLIWGGSALIHQRVRLYQVNREIARLTAETRQVEHLLKESRDLAAQMEGMHKIGQATDTLEILKKLTQLIPDNTWLFNLRLSKENLEIGGMSQSASELIPRLDKSGWLEKTEFASPIVTDASKFDHFKIRAKVKGLAATPAKAVAGAPPAGLAAHRRADAGSDLSGHRQSIIESGGQLERATGQSHPGPGQVPGPGRQ